MIAVHFHDLDEFLTELDKHAEDAEVVIERAIVRATPSYRSGVTGLTSVFVLASFVSTRMHSVDELVHLNARCGDLWGHDDRDAEVRERRDTLIEAIRSACEWHGLDLRSGMHTTAGA